MKKINLFSIASDENVDSYTNKSHLLLNQTATSTELKGELIEHQFELNKNYFLILSKLESWGESIYFYLLDSKINILDELAISGDIFDSPSLSNFIVVSESEVEFSYYNEYDRWSLKVYDKKKLILPKLNPFSMISRSTWTKQLFSHFELKRLT